MKAQHKLISIVVPVFNEARNIFDNLSLLIEEVERHFQAYEILVVSDGSTDETNRLLADISHPNIRAVVYEKNQGKGYAIRKGFQLARGEYIFFIDGGMELHPKELRIFFGLMELYDADIVVGSKRHPQSKVFYPWYRKLLSRIYQAFIRKLFSVDVTDTQVGIKLFRRDVIQAILPDLEINRYGFDLEILSLAALRGYTEVLEAPIRLNYFLKNKRFILKELLHIFKVGLSLMSDTWHLYLKLQRIRKGSS